ncbi:hypothetical protein EHI8A_005770 [Entamoeba histolytica HM-1:IMSS-B]|uniref:ENTH domain-containing protein n=5 Tax=Entamoeba histolytica TaxID=5759 RepID=C4M320_ENTH1|nr:hypothetical protein EHI_025330 [Entamoeba histolytica HM-1:IMSS]EAL47557.1 hypothetical protein EHI_025330 [Entamoeba histolytica HM-1:IMSS]EMH74280.1 hypothetical protein EHI8A_005770 [Entamoeba histolytica HM-1:IMSS-B]EMS13708.1 hypothetical protein KM1_021460 [Entamoeba histolytica HM-3:IMSS]ENY65503.1 hypothetical protein EHI7A_009050 [Entamoeba histolytica HM-1:IMSS-A]|eukprot:XP_652943.1 hypothetical protein EHI_025330 [Entamoeba histolytica HM-1:IMSS]
MSVIEMIKCINKSDEETILIKATRNEENPPKEKHIEEIIYYYIEDVDSTRMTELICELIKKNNNKGWIEVQHLLIIILNIIKVDYKKELLKKIKKEHLQFGIFQLGLTEKDDLTRIFCKYIDSIIKLYERFDIIMEENTPLTPLCNEIDWRNAFNAFDIIIGLFNDLKQIHWKNVDLYLSKLTIYVIELLIKEMAIILIKLSYYIKTFLIDCKSIKNDDIMKLISKLNDFDSIQHFYFQKLPKLIPSSQIPTFPILSYHSEIFSSLINSLELTKKYDQQIQSKLLLDVLNEFSLQCSLNETPLREFIHEHDTYSHSSSHSLSHSSSHSAASSCQRSRSHSKPSSTSNSRKNSLSFQKQVNDGYGAIGVSLRLSEMSPKKKEGYLIKTSTPKSGTLDELYKKRSHSKSGKIDIDQSHLRKKSVTTPSDGVPIKKSFSFSN